MRRIVPFLLLPLALTGLQPADAGDLAPTSIVRPIVVDAPFPVAGEPLTLGATLVSNGVPVVGQPVRLLLRRYGGDTFHVHSEVVTNATGSVKVTLTRLKNTRFQWVFPGNGELAASASDRWTERFSPHVGITVSDQTPEVGQRVVITCHTYPAKRGHRVSLWRGVTSRGGYGINDATRLATSRVRRDGTFTLRHTFTSAGSRRVFVKVAGGHGNAPGWSDYRIITVG